MTQVQRYSVFGVVQDPVFAQCSDAAEYVNGELPEKYHIDVVKEMPSDFYDRRRQFVERGDLREPGSRVVVVRLPDSNAECASEYCETGAEFLSRISRETPFRLLDVLAPSHPDSYTSRARQALVALLRSTNNSFCWMDISIDGAPAGRITFELYSSQLPRTSANFAHLCRGDRTTSTGPLTYRGSSFFRCAPGAWVMGGDVSEGHRGNGGDSIYGRVFPDEGFMIPHDARGVLGMCNDGPNTNASSFYITMGPMSWMNKRYVAFGRVIDGMDVVEAIHAVNLRHNQSFSQDIAIVACDEIDLA